jgi:hypothetical protein
MFGTFQQSTVRVQVVAGAEAIGRCLTEFALLRRWAWMQNFPADLPERMHPGLEFDSHFGPVLFGHRVARLAEDDLELVLWGGVDGRNRWHWGDGWVQSTIEGVSALPLGLGQTALLDSLARFAAEVDNTAA